MAPRRLFRAVKGGQFTGWVVVTLRDEVFVADILNWRVQKHVRK